MWDTLGQGAGKKGKREGRKELHFDFCNLNFVQDESLFI